MIWYTPDHTNASFTQGDIKAPWEGIGTGWFHSVLGGGSQLRPYFDGGKKTKSELSNFENYLKNNRVSVLEDNTYSARMRGDYAVPTLFNGNFDAVAAQLDSQPIPSITTLSNPVVGSNSGSINYALKLGTGDSITHNPFVVPDWGNLRFDVFAPTQSGTLNVKLETIDGQSKNVIINLAQDANFQIDAANNNNTESIKNIYSDIENKIGFGRKGFETFQLKLNLTDLEIADFRGKSAKITFSLDGGDSVYIDNVFFKSEHLKFGNPTQARWNPSNSTYKNNLLLEKPQYAVSYNADTKIANWVGWKVDKTWVTRPKTQPGELPNGLIKRPEFIADPDLFASGLSTYDGNIFTGLGMDRGHLSPDRDRRRHPKDQLATYLTTNLIAQSMDNNRFFGDSDNPDETSAWFNIEDKVVDERANQGQELYIFAGAIGNNPNTQKKTNVPELLDDLFNGELINQGNTSPSNLSNRQIHIPRWTWKTIMAVEQPGVDVTSSNIEAFAYMTPNIAEPNWNNVSLDGIANPLNNDMFSPFLDSVRSNIKKTDWRNPDTWRVTLPELTKILNERNKVRNYDFKFDFLSNLPEDIQ
ncbi:MAG: DNA/RNA non-specific endonuclease [Microcoleus sp. PH2017_01_SCD_O_A]|uniref:DNA/RNA non-specific endonuclease n=1 Tax=Microcoleus sp. PH2017_01_SCD_O_A TaxID=2798812 RepID=UPI001D80FA7F|nr:DNA/RNA non-specific endonuclease [Microcoleus sp. PH2017_01_SCD_O_A]MCC3427705.1 DNA/RNA non-specific endonuclease [Microcoleus sp. PH2017_01_SCD_O_A]